MARRLSLLFFVLALSSLPCGAEARNSWLSETLGGGLFCLDQLNQQFFVDWLTKEYGSPTKHDGQAFWFDLRGVKLFGATLRYVFVGDGTSAYDFIGATFEEPQSDLKADVDGYRGRSVEFEKREYGYESKTGTKIVADPDGGGSKMYCAINVR